VTDPVASCVRYDKDRRVDVPDSQYSVTRFPLLAGACAEFVGSNPGFRQIGKKSVRTMMPETEVSVWYRHSRRTQR
jgi:hypothetical protein